MLGEGLRLGLRETIRPALYREYSWNFDEKKNSPCDNDSQYQTTKSTIYIVCFFLNVALCLFFMRFDRIWDHKPSFLLAARMLLVVFVAVLFLFLSGDRLRLWRVSIHVWAELAIPHEMFDWTMYKCRNQWWGWDKESIGIKNQTIFWCTMNRWWCYHCWRPKRRDSPQRMERYRTQWSALELEASWSVVRPLSGIGHDVRWCFVERFVHGVCEHWKSLEHRREPWGTAARDKRRRWKRLEKRFHIEDGRCCSRVVRQYNPPSTRPTYEHVPRQWW